MSKVLYVLLSDSAASPYLQTLNVYMYFTAHHHDNGLFFIMVQIHLIHQVAE